MAGARRQISTKARGGRSGGSPRPRPRPPPRNASGDRSRLATRTGPAGQTCVTAGRLATTPVDSSHVSRDNNTRDSGLVDGLLGLFGFPPVSASPAVSEADLSAALARAETPFTGALPWGLTQVATVVLAFAALGPTLGLRTPRST